MRAVYAIARNTFMETVRQPAYGLVGIVCAAVLVLSTQFSGHIYTFGAGSGLKKPADRMVAELGLSTLLAAGLVLAVLSTANVVGREIENRTALSVLSKKIGRAAFVVGKFFGVALAVGLAIVSLLMFLLLTLRMGVSITAADTFDTGVIVALIAAPLLAVLVATFRNYYGGRPWIGTFSLSFMALTAVAFLFFALFDKTYRPSFLPLPTGEAWDALEYTVRENIGITYDVEVVKAGLLTLGSVIVMVAVALAASTRLAAGGNLAVTGLVALAGLTSEFFRDAVAAAAATRATGESWFWLRRALLHDQTIPETLYNIYYALAPNLQHFWMVDALSREVDIPWSYVGESMGYGALYAAAMVCVACFLFERREVA